MNNVSCQMNQRGVVVAAAGIVLGAVSQASLIDGSRCRLQTLLPAEHSTIAARPKSSAASGQLKQACAAEASRPRHPPAIGSMPSQVVSEQFFG
jgi:hypothetical protein